MTTTSVKPVIRCPRSGLLDRHPAYEGWYPKGRGISVRGWMLLANSAFWFAMALWFASHG